MATVVRNPERLLLALILLDVPLQLDTHLDYHQEAAKLSAIGGLGISLTTLALMVLYPLWIARLLTGRETHRPWLRASLPMALYVGWAMLSLITAQDRTFAFFEAFVLVQSFLMFVYVGSTVRSRGDLLFVFTMLAVGLAIEGAIVLVNHLVGPSFRIPGLVSQPELSRAAAAGPYRAVGTFGSPNVAGGYLATTLAITLSLLLARVTVGYRALALVSSGLGGVALVVTFSRGSWLAFAASMALFCVVGWRSGWLPRIIPLATAGVAAVLFAVYQESIVARLLNAEAAEGRIPLIFLALRMIADHPLLGVGLNNFHLAISQHLTPEFDGAWLSTVHNKYLLVWAETGTPGLAAFVAFLLATLHRGWRGWRSGDQMVSMLAVGLTAALLGQMVHMAVEVFNSRPQVQLLWLTAALIASLAAVAKEQAARTAENSDMSPETAS